MGFDPSKDKVLKVIGEVQSKDKEVIIVSINKYGKGDPKLAMTRKGIGWNEQEYSSAIGRLTWEEAQEVIPLLNKALKVLENC